MTTTTSVRAPAATSLIHNFGGGLFHRGGAYAVEWFRALANGDIRRWPAEVPAGGKARAGLVPEVASVEDVQELRPLYNETIVCTSLEARSRVQYWGVATGLFGDRMNGADRPPSSLNVPPSVRRCNYTGRSVMPYADPRPTPPIRTRTIALADCPAPRARTMPSLLQKRIGTQATPCAPPVPRKDGSPTGAAPRNEGQSGSRARGTPRSGEPSTGAPADGPPNASRGGSVASVGAIRTSRTADCAPTAANASVIATANAASRPATRRSCTGVCRSPPR